MPIRLPNIGSCSGLPVHERWLTLLIRNQISNKEFRGLQRLTSGLIIVKWVNGVGVEYLNQVDIPYSFVRFDDRTIREDPFMYLTLKGIVKKVKRLRDQSKADFGIAFWTHPEIDFKPSEFALLTEFGKRFSGSPTQ